MKGGDGQTSSAQVYKGTNPRDVSPCGDVPEHLIDPPTTDLYRKPLLQDQVIDTVRLQRDKWSQTTDALTVPQSGGRAPHDSTATQWIYHPRSLQAYPTSSRQGQHILRKYLRRLVRSHR